MKAFNIVNEEQKGILGMSSGNKPEFKSFFQQIISNAEKMLSDTHMVEDTVKL